MILLITICKLFLEIIFSPGNEGKIMINFDFHLVESSMDQLPYKERAKSSNFMVLDANLKIIYNGVIHFDEDIAIIEFWLQLDDWLNKRNYESFHYYTIELEDEFNPLI